jgi:hypothetical protein
MRESGAEFSGNRNSVPPLLALRVSVATGNMGGIRRRGEVDAGSAKQTVNDWGRTRVSARCALGSAAHAAGSFAPVLDGGGGFQLRMDKVGEGGTGRPLGKPAPAGYQPRSELRLAGFNLGRRARRPAAKCPILRRTLLSE